MALSRVLDLYKSASLSPHKTSLRSVLRGTPMRLADAMVKTIIHKSAINKNLGERGYI